MKKNKKRRASKPLPYIDKMREQNAIIVETFAEACGVLGLLSCSDGKEWLDELMKESSMLENDEEFQNGIPGIFYFLKICSPNAEPDATYTDAQIDSVRTWLLRIYERPDLRMYDGDVEEIFDLWHIEFVRHKQYWE